MAQVQTTRSGTTNTLRGSDRANSSIHEDLLDMFTNEDRSETPLVSMMGSSKASNINHEWLVDNYRDPAENAASEGGDFAAADSAQTPRRRLGNFTQIFRQTIAVSGTAVAVDTAGVANEFAHQIKKKVVELRRDIERQYTLYWPSSATNPTGAQAAAVVKDGTDPRHAGSIFTFAQTHLLGATGGSTTTGLTVYGAAGGAGTAYAPASYNADGTTFVGDAAANASPGANLGDTINDLMEAMYNEGGKPNVLLTGTSGKVALSRAFTAGGGGGAGVASQRNLDAMAMKLNIAITSVMTDFGFDLMLMPSYIMQNFSNSSNVILAVDTSMVKRAVLRPIFTNKLDDGGDGKRALIICEETLRVDNPQSVGAVYNVGF